MNPLRPVILAAAGSPRLAKAVTTVPATAAVVRRFVAGADRAALLPVLRELLADGRRVSVDFLGENTTDPAQADAVVAEYLALIGDLATLADAPGVERGPEWAVPLEVSVKLSALGQALPEPTAIDRLRTICEAAERAGVWVTVDAEDHTATAGTLATVHALRPEFPWLGVVLQSYLHRTEADCGGFASEASRVRLCKGAYNEPPEVAFQHSAEVTDSYLRCLDVLMKGDGYPMVASHDPALVEAAIRAGIPRYEHQMLYGVRDLEQRRLAAEGRAVRVYVPYGTEWYGYLTRRLAERPANLGFFLRALVSRS
ncbi:proline dehydrogenase family protein [Nocardia asteroides]|uniref:proline dehydrogenase family protein n=1 Tax=Nocardia asteroides TaxID=1824 RepID=UPI001E5DA7A3|nr:proline dehydrogenase family protein [Nocardia asteroides]UGT64241.1 proline dehydrogenase family protein [Nocardia asteroides]